MSSSSTIAPTTGNNQSNATSNESAIHEYMKQFIDYQENGVDLNEISQIRQLDIYLQNCYNRVREIVNNLKDKTQSTQSQSDMQILLINTLVQAKAIGDKKMQLSQQMLDTTEKQSKKLKLAYQKYVESINQQSTTTTENNSNENDSDNDYDSEITNHRSLSTKVSTTSLWKRRTTANNPSNSTINLKRKSVNYSEHNNDQRDRKKATQKGSYSNQQNTNSGNNRRLKLSNDSSAPSDEPTYCLCSQLSYGSMILCDSKSCEIKWFHFNCVNLTTKPKGKWFCPNCRDNRS